MKNQELKTYLDKNFSEVYNRLDNHSRRFDAIDQKFERIDERFDQIDQRFEKVDERFGQIDQRFEDLETRLTNRIREAKNEVTSELKEYIHDSFEAQQTFIQFELGHDVADHERRITHLERQAFKS